MPAREVAAVWLCSAVACAALAADQQATKPIPHRLSNAETVKLAALACPNRQSTQQDEINAWTERGSRTIHASVSCQPHATTPHYTTYHRAECSRGGQWQCGRSETWLHTELDSQQIDIATNGYKPELAYSLISKLAAYRLPKGDPVLEGASVQCTLRKGPSKELLDISCNDKLIRLSYWCPQSSCPRVFWINGYFVPADAGGL